MKFIDKLSHKRKRQVLGMMMFAMFIAEVQVMYFFAKVCLEHSSGVYISFLFVLGLFWYFWVPPIVCVCLIYLILMRVVKYQEVDK